MLLINLHKKFTDVKYEEKHLLLDRTDIYFSLIMLETRQMQNIKVPPIPFINTIIHTRTDVFSS